ncbi:MAG: hypothetical protein GX072_10745 [Lysinibacillus sp.]|nr:hypothetical protein [Lysinibacillus sp.]
MSISKGQLLTLIEKLPISAQITTYYYLKDLSKSKVVQDEMEYDYFSFANQTGNSSDRDAWIDAFMEFHFETK